MDIKTMSGTTHTSEKSYREQNKLADGADVSDAMQAVTDRVNREAEAMGLEVRYELV